MPTNSDPATPREKHPRDYDPQLSHYRQPSLRRGIWQLTSTVLLLAVGWTAMLFSISISYWLTLLLAIPTAAMLVRLFIFQHDCGHRSFFKSQRANDIAGSLLGVLTMTPYQAWRREHAQHHAGSGNLERRGNPGEIWTMTVEEYREAGFWRRLWYRLYRNPLVMFGPGALYYFAIQQRLPFVLPKSWKLERKSVHLTNLALVALVALLCWLVGPLHFVMVQLPVMAVAASLGVWMFYVQHQYEEAYWEAGENWNYVDAALEGSSHYRLPKILHWCTGNIGYHHIHHLDSRIPNYNLPACHNNNPEVQQVPTLSLWESLACTRYKLWDSQRKRMVSFAEAARNAVADSLQSKSEHAGGNG